MNFSWSWCSLRACGGLGGLLSTFRGLGVPFDGLGLRLSGIPVLGVVVGLVFPLVGLQWDWRASGGLGGFLVGLVFLFVLSFLGLAVGLVGFSESWCSLRACCGLGGLLSAFHGLGLPFDGLGLRLSRISFTGVVVGLAFALFPILSIGVPQIRGPALAGIQL